MILTKAGTPLYLSLQLGTGATDKYPIAILKDHLGNELAGSPVSLTNRGNGMYFNESILMPSLSVVVCTYKVYNDSGHTVLSDKDADGTDIFILDDREIPKFEDTIVGICEDSSNVFTLVDDSGQIVAEIAADETVGLISGDDVYIGEISDILDYHATLLE